MSRTDGIPEEALSLLAHELNTPISVIVGYAELLESRSEETATREGARNIKEAAERLRATVDALLSDTGSR